MDSIVYDKTINFYQNDNIKNILDILFLENDFDVINNPYDRMLYEYLDTTVLTVRKALSVFTGRITNMGFSATHYRDALSGPKYYSVQVWRESRPV
jgi:hypothetical protein